MKKLIVIGLCVFVLAGCDKPKIDASSEEAIKTSISKIKDSLPEDQKERFSDSAALVITSHFNIGDLMKDAFSGKSSADIKVLAETKKQEAFKSLDGKTADDIIAEADKIRAERAVKEKEQALQEISDLKSAKEKSLSDKNALKSFAVTKSRFYLQPEEYGDPKPVIDINVANNTGKAISRAYFRGTIATPGRSVPWLVKEFNYQISGGLEPGEKADWSLAPNRFSEWGKVEAPADAVFTVEVMRLDGADGNPLFDSSQFTDEMQKRLENLEKSFQTK